MAGPTVLDRDGQVRPLASLWADRPTVVAFLRHFGWLFCREQAAQLSGIADELEKLGVGLALIGSGNPEQAKDFAREFGVTVPLYVDPRREAYQAFDLAHGVGATLNFESVAHGLRAFTGGFRQGAVQGDPWQQGGVFLVMPDGSMPYAYRSRSAGDHPGTEAVLAGVRGAIAK